jgi:hypothetical protein
MTLLVTVRFGCGSHSFLETVFTLYPQNRHAWLLNTTGLNIALTRWLYDQVGFGGLCGPGGGVVGLCGPSGGDCGLCGPSGKEPNGEFG